MSSTSIIVCDCGAPVEKDAFMCARCGKCLDGSAGNTIPSSRRVTVPGRSVRASGSRRFPPPAAQNPGSRKLEASRGIEAKVAVVTFSARAQVVQAPAPPHEARPFTLTPDSSTNEAAGLELAGKLHREEMAHARLNIVLLGDGVPTAGGGLFGSDSAAAEEAAQLLKQQGARIATIGFAGPTMDFGHLRKLASSPALTFEARAGNVTPVFLLATQSLTVSRWGQKGAELVVFVIDSSGSMDEGNKKQEVEAAVAASIEFLRTL
ncbi:MAG TPA: VWA domain-containing protein [Candidatus Hydrogenedentes bacterium]|nr:VWA domain-containing protein [Candidatus Hydrogenedentota bacterium]